MTEKPVDSKYPHLGKKALEIAELSNVERIEHVKTAKWIEYTAAKNILADLQYLVTFPEDLRPPCRLIIGDSNNGKTSIIDRFVKMYPSDENLGGENVIIPVVAVSAVRADEKALYDWILTSLFARYDPKLGVSESQKLLIVTLRRLKPKLIIIDEAHELAKGANRNVTACLSALKAITNLARIPIAAFGTDEALNAFSLDDQIENRFEPIYLPRWKWDKEFRGLLLAFEKTLPLREESGLKQPVIGQEILERTGGLLGEVRKLLTDSAIHALENDKEHITLRAIQECRYRPVSNRRSKPH